MSEEEQQSCPIDVTPSMIAGLVEVLVLWGGRIDLHRLARETGMETGHLLRVAEVARALRFVEVANGDLILTREGQAFSRKGTSGKLGMLKELVQGLEPFRSIIALLSSVQSPLSVEEINERLGLCAVEEEQLRRLNSFIIDWLVATGILEYDGESSSFRIKRTRRSKP
ncbi:MAG: AAA-associated domain-containing protein [Aigarchaeota archaeon]|nr:AAA-associated domain-containing protein [Aigarchaeota archaeon]MCS7127320.1 AAA-associated domain-containing protein [Candidatus Calditenuaceae archaeon]MDW8042889.1 AAA-associated domain-containing protein [Nitrososphaerota archaeon]